MASLGLLRMIIPNMMDVAKDRPNLLRVSQGTLPLCMHTGRDLPSENVLAVVVSKVDLRCATNGDTLGCSIIGLHHIRHCGIDLD